MFYYTLTNGLRTGFVMFVGGSMKGRGQTTGINYTAVGSEDYTFTNFNPVTGDGTFVITDDYHVHADSSLFNTVWHRVVRFVVSQGGNHIQFQPDEVVCL